MIDWDATFKKGARTKDGVSVGVIIKVHDDSIVIQDAPRIEYEVPKDAVEAFDGH